MKFKKLTIHNIASIEDAVIDFEAEPLAGSNVFLISGNTGSGKSTILDCICLALYGTTPRFTSNKMQDSESSKEVLETTIGDERQMLRRNTGKGYVTLTFQGSNGVDYEAFWGVARARTKVDGKLQAKEWTLKNCQTNELHRKGIDVRAEIEKCVNLKFEDFCRTTMLAQGEFTKFLNSDNNEKAKILETITGVTAYKKIGAKIYEMHDRFEKHFKEAQRDLEGTVTLADGQVAQMKAALDDCKERRNAEENKRQNYTEKLDWLKAYQDALTKEAKAVEAAEKAKADVKTPEFIENDSIVNDWEKSISARKWLADSIAEQLVIDVENSKLASMQSMFATVAGSVAGLRSQIADSEHRLAQLQSAVAAESTRAVVYEKVQSVLNDIALVAGAKTDIETYRAKIAEQKQLLDSTFVPEYNKAATKVEEGRKVLDNSEETLKLAEQKLNEMQLPQLRKSLDGAKDILAKADKAALLLKSFCEAQSAYEQTSKELAETAEAIRLKNEKLKEIEIKGKEARIKCETANQAYEAQKATIDGLFADQRSKLSVGDTCPLCRQTVVAAIPHEEEIALLVKGVEMLYKEAKDTYDNICDEYRTLKSDIDVQTEAYNKKRKNHDEDNSVVVKREAALQAFSECSVNDIDHQALEALKANADKEKQSLEQQIQTAELIEEQVKQLRQNRDECRVDYDNLFKTSESAKKKVETANAEINTCNALIQSKKDDMEAAAKQVDEDLAHAQWTTDWRKDSKAFTTELTESAKAYKANIDAINNVSQSIKDHGVQADHTEKVIKQILEKMPQWKVAEVAPVTPVDKLIDVAANLLNAVTEARTKIDTAQTKLNLAKSEFDAFMADNQEFTKQRLEYLQTIDEAEIAQKKNMRQMYRDKVVETGAQLTVAVKEKENLECKKPEFAPDESVETLTASIGVCNEAIHEVSIRQGELQNELEKDAETKAKRSELIAEVESRRKVYEKWSRLNKMLGDSQGNVFSKIAQSYVLSNLIHSANTYMRQLSDRYQLKNVPGSFVIQIEDAYQGFATRAANTISGGESFLVSLALALALSDIGSQWKVDTLFIDEGFGTLSGEALNNAVNTLATLHTTAGRHVGIISHVEELRERIPVQIRVQQDKRSSSSRIEVIAK